MVLENKRNSYGPGVFPGPEAIRNFLDPDQQAPVPLVELPPALNPLAGERVRIFAKLMYLLPLLNLKSLVAMNLLAEAKSAGKLDGVHTLVEASSGNTAFCLAILAGLFGVRSTQAVVPRDIAPGKLELLRLSGADPVFSKEGPGEQGGIAQARALGREAGFFNAGQYENEANPGAHEKWTAKQLWEQLGDRLTVYCCGLGTTGALLGVRRFWERRNAKLTVVGVMCAPNQAVPGVRSEQRLREIGFDWRSGLEHAVEMETKESFRQSLRLCRHGLMAGPSSGFAYAGLRRFLETQRAAGRLDALRNGDGEVVAAFLCGDTPLPYLDKYSTHLDAEDFETRAAGA